MIFSIAFPNNKILLILNLQRRNYIRLLPQALYNRIDPNSKALHRFRCDKRIQEYQQGFNREVEDEEVVENIVQFGVHDLLVKVSTVLSVDLIGEALEHLLDALLFESHSEGESFGVLLVEEMGGEDLFDEVVEDYEGLLFVAKH